MKNFKFIAVFLCVFLLGHTTLASDEEAEESCGTGKVYNTSLNRCVLNTETVETKSDARSCSGLEGEAFKKCFDDNVQKDLTDAQTAGDIKGQSDPESKYGVPAVVTLGAGYLLWKKSDVLAQCGQTSMWLMLGGGVTSILGEFMSQNSYKKELKKIIKKYQDKMSSNPEDKDEKIAVINENQKLAFDFQIEQEKARKDAHKARKSAYNLSFGLYSAAALASLYDGLFSSSKGCETAMYTPIKTPSPFSRTYHAMLLNNNLFGEYSFISTLKNTELLEIIKRNLASQLSINLHAQLPPAPVAPVRPESIIQTLKPDPVNILDTSQLKMEVPKFEMPKFKTEIPKLEAPQQAAELGPSQEQLGNKIDKLNSESGTDSSLDKAIKSPWVRAAIAGILAGYSKNVANKAGKLADETQDRINLLETLRDDFIATGGSAFQACTPEDRDDLSKLNCYCFLSDGTRNPNRNSSNACQNVYATAAKLKATEYGVNTAGNSSTGMKGCFDKSRKYDPDCKCKQDKDKSGKNSCFALSGKVKLGGLASIGELKSVMKDARGFTNGNISTGSLNQGGIERLALKANKLKKKIENNPKYKKNALKVKKLQQKLKKKIESRTKRGLASGAITNPFGGGLSSASSPISKQSVLKNLKKDLAKKLPTRKRGGSARTGTRKGSLSDYDLGGGSSGGSIVIDNAGSIMKKEYKFNDINENSNNNIFKIISVRYQRSAFRRLFDESGRTRADAPGETEINEK